jgi:siroheme synthase-like protein
MYPIFLNLDGKKCLVVGGGRVALRKVLALIRSNADVTVIASECCDRLKQLESNITLHIRPFKEEDLTGKYLLVIGATDSQEVNSTISQRAAQLNIPCNIVDQPSLCSFFVPAQVRQGNVNIAISTDGVSPRFSRYLKGVIGETIQPLHGELAAYLGTIRNRLRTEIPDITLRSAFWEKIFEEDPVEVIRLDGWDTFRMRVEKCIFDFTQQIENDGKK